MAVKMVSLMYLDIDAKCVVAHPSRGAIVD